MFTDNPPATGLAVADTGQRPPATVRPGLRAEDERLATLPDEIAAFAGGFAVTR